MDIENVTSNNLSVDICLELHANAVHLYMDSMERPALAAIDARHEELARRGEPGAVFTSGDVEELRKSTIEAFA